ncbi:efflux RND transporter periplasmic adaptor subunit [Luteithermobacter gelatinilyticus]|uniref:efflux RND transporter periplasmic adaptor subunit n=1 Tax=Luteithermobacter gelatinilyticus TaxID=2582913 RepID=UPI001106696C|nr:efflux RND transporter periplasmic adaptor subunit [Luteithermobacter gelatinilyticus]|tara:strand:- start:15044 stop:16123 length:1080 start_codon:yes stop_codon:yes gene_type:complete
MFLRLLFILLLLAAGLAAYFYLPKETGPQNSAGSRVVQVIAAPVKMDEFIDTVEALGTCKANESVILTASTTDKVAAINFSDGMVVRKGTVLATLDNDEEMADLREAEANLAEQERELKRIRGLVQAKTLPTARLDAQKTLYEKALAQVQMSRARLKDRQIIAPFDGRLGLRQISVGALLTPGTIITTIDDLSVIKVDFTVPEAFISALKQGQKIKARSEAYDRIFEGTVTTIDTRVNPVSRAVTVRAEIPNPDMLLRPGMLLSIDLIKNRAKSIMIPEEAVIIYEDRKYVFVVQEDNTTARRQIVTGRRRPGAVEVLSGLEVGELVVTQGLLKVQDGTRVEVRPLSPEDGTVARTEES